MNTILKNRLGMHKFITVDGISILFVIMFLTEILQQVFGITSLIYFAIDIPILILIANCIKQKFRIIKICKLEAYVFLVCLSFISSCLGAMLQGVGWINFIYGTYKFFRVFVFFFGCIACATYKNTLRTIGIIRNVFWINVFITLVQFLFFGLRQDTLGGIFGTTVGVNQYTNLFFTLCTVYIISGYFCEKIKFRVVVWYLVPMLLIAALAEIKFYFLEFMIICGISFLFSKKKIKMYARILFLFLLAYTFYEVLVRLFPEFRNLTFELVNGGIQRLINMQRHYSTEYDIGRGSAFSEIGKRYLINIKNKLWGIGIGSATSFSLADNTFFYNNADTHYDQFLISYLFLEQGYIGTFLYLFSFVFLWCKGIIFVLRDREKQAGMTIVLLSICSVLLYVYNMSMYGQFNFLIYWGIAAATKWRYCLNN